MKRTRRDWGKVALGLGVGFLFGEVKQFTRPDAALAWTFALLSLAFVGLGLFLLYGPRQTGGGS